MLTIRPDIYCGACGECRPLGQFRLLSPSPLLYLDFCGVCEDGIGLRKLYGDEKYAKWVNPKVVEALKRDPAKKKKQETMRAGAEEAKQAIPEVFPAENIDERRRELARRELMRRRFIYYVTQNAPDYLAGWVHKDIARRLEQFMLDIENKLSPRLMLFMPPRSGKSHLVSQEFPSWVLGHHPNWEIISASYTADLPIGFSRTIRDRLKSSDYQAMFPGSRLRTDSQGVEQWHLQAGGRYRAAGVGVGITGTGAHCVVPYCTINTPNGIIPAYKVKVGDTVYGYDHDSGCVEAATVVAVCVKPRRKPLVNFGGAIVTSDHPIYANGEYRAAELVAGMSGLRLEEGSARAEVYELLPESLSGKQHQAGMQSLREGVHTAARRDRERQGQVQPEDNVLQPNLLQRLPHCKSRTVWEKVARGVHWLRRAIVREGAEKVLLSSVLPAIPGAESRISRVQRGVPGHEIAGGPEVQGMPNVWSEEGTHGSTPRGPQSIEQRYDESGAAVLDVPQAVSRTSGDTAESLAGLLLDDDYVVDFQTTTHNFFASNLLISNCILIDDPIKDYQEAQSEVVRETAYNWYTTTAKTRLAPGGGVLLLQTRWHDGDLAGRLLTDEQVLLESGVPEDEYDHWQVVNYPAIAEADEYLMPTGLIVSDPPELPEGSKLLRSKGEALHPERYSLNGLMRIKNSMPPVQWNALYQQNPVPDSGEYFSNDMFRFYQDLPGTPEEFTFFMAWDLAIGEKTQNDYTVGTVGAMHINGDLYVVDMIRARMNTFQIIEAILTMAKKWPNLQVVGIEDGQIKKTMAPLLKQAMQTAKSSFSLDETLKPVTDKLMRARPLQSRMQMGQLLIPAGQPWANILQHELLRFPNGVHDDIVDSLAWLARMGLYLKGPVMRTGEARRKKQKSWKDDLKMHVAGSSGGRSFMTA